MLTIEALHEGIGLMHVQTIAACSGLLQMILILIFHARFDATFLYGSVPVSMGFLLPYRAHCSVFVKRLPACLVADRRRRHREAFGHEFEEQKLQEQEEEGTVSDPSGIRFWFEFDTSAMSMPVQKFVGC